MGPPLRLFTIVTIAASSVAAVAPDHARAIDLAASQGLQLQRLPKARSSVWAHLSADGVALHTSSDGVQEGHGLVQPCYTDKNSPWQMMQCWRKGSTSLMMTDSTRRPAPSSGSSATSGTFVGVGIFVAAIFFAIYGIRDVHKFLLMLVHRHAEQLAGAEGEESPDKKAATSHEPDKVGYYQQNWSMAAIICLTSYRFYSGFLSATWLPYLLAMEGQDLWQEKQALFMGLAKLIYAATILMNPIFGLVGDQATKLSHGVGRRMFVRIGVTLAALGIYICVLAGKDHAFLSFLSGIAIWRLGEALNDVTTEALIPDMVPQDQYQIGAAIKASSFLLGGLFGYTLLLLYADAHYSWLYYAYPIGMFVCSIPSLLLLDQEHPLHVLRNTAPPEDSKNTFADDMMHAYLGPLNIQGGFPRACLALFFFSLGTAPMFFLLLIVRDVVGIEDPVLQQKLFSISSIIFFLSAAASSACCAMSGEGGRAGRENTRDNRHLADMIQSRGKMLIIAIVAFGSINLIIPGLNVFETVQSRNTAFYIVTVFFGASFGVAFSIFQDLIWLFLPTGVNIANAMGFSLMCRLSGVGLGNFVSGLILDLFWMDHGPGMYAAGGYFLMCCCSGLAVLISAVLAASAIQKSVDALLPPQQAPSEDPEPAMRAA